MPGRKIYRSKPVAWPGQNQGIVKEPKTKNGNGKPVIVPQLLIILQQHKKESGYVIRGERAQEKQIERRMDKSASYLTGL